MLGIGVNLDFEDPRLQRFASSLTNDSSALVLVADEAILNEFAAAAKRFDFGGEMLDINLTDSDLQALRKALRG
jgi:hypothetical protein